MPGFFKCLKANGERNITIIGCDIADDEANKLFVDRYYKVPPYYSTEYVNTLLDICKKEHVDVFFPHISMELPFIIKRLSDFVKNGVKVAISSKDTLSIANDKFKLYEFMREKGLETPHYFFVDSSITLNAKKHDLGFPKKPICVKMTSNSGSRGVRIVHPSVSKSDLFIHDKPSSLNITLEEMCEIMDECETLPPIMAMEYFPGIEYTVDLLADKGKTLYIAGRRNTSSNMSIAQSSVVDRINSAYKLCEDIVRELHLDGNIGFDFMLDENGKPWLTDLNPRVTATIILYLGAGLNLPYLRVKQLMGEELPIVNIQYGTKLIRKYNDILYNSKGLIKV